MPNSGLNCLSCLCSCLLVIVNVVAIIFGLLFLAIGSVFAFGMRLITGNAYVADLLASVSRLLKDYVSVDVDIHQLVQNLGSLTGSVGATFIVIGVVIIALSCLGCCGGCCKKKPCLIVYAVIVGLMFLGQLIVVIIWYADSNILKTAAKGAMEDSVRKYTGINSANVESLVQNVIQIYAGCCGVNNGSDFHSLSVNWDRQYTVSQGGRNYTFNLTYPVSCCKFDLRSMRPYDLFCPYNNSRSSSNHHMGCYTEIFYYIDTYFLNFLFFVLAGVLGLQLLLIAGAVVISLSSSAAKKTTRVQPQPVSWRRGGGGTIDARQPVPWRRGSGVTIDARQK